MSGVYTGELELYHGTGTYFETPRIPDIDGNSGGQGMHQYGLGFYMAATPQDPAKARSYATTYAGGNGMVMQAHIPANGVALLNFDEALGDDLAQRLRTQLQNINTGSPDVNAYYRDLAGDLNGEVTGKQFWSAISSAGDVERFIAGQRDVSAIIADSRQQITKDRRAVYRGLDDYDSETPLSEGNARKIAENLRAIESGNPELDRYYRSIADDVRPGMLGRDVGARFDTNGFSRFLNSSTPQIDRNALARGVELGGTQVLNSAGLDGLFIPSEDTVVFKGQQGLSRLPRLNIIETIGNFVLPARTATPEADPPASRTADRQPAPDSEPPRAPPQPAPAAETGRTRPASSEPGSTPPGRAGTTSFGERIRGAGAAIGVVGVVTQVNDENFQRDLSRKDTRGLAQTQLAMNAGAATLDGAESTLQALRTGSKLARFAAPAAVALEVGAGAVEYNIASRQGDGKRAAQAIGRTGGAVAGGVAGAVGGAKLGAVIGGTIGSIIPGAGTLAGAAVGGVVGGIIGGVGGAIGGGMVGEAAVNRTNLAANRQQVFDRQVARDIETRFDRVNDPRQLRQMILNDPALNSVSDAKINKIMNSPAALNKFKADLTAANLRPNTRGEFTKVLAEIDRLQEIDPIHRAGAPARGGREAPQAGDAPAAGGRGSLRRTFSSVADTIEHKYDHVRSAAQIRDLIENDRMTSKINDNTLDKILDDPAKLQRFENQLNAMNAQGAKHAGQYTDLLAKIDRLQEMPGMGGR